MQTPNVTYVNPNNPYECSILSDYQHPYDYPKCSD